MKRLVLNVVLALSTLAISGYAYYLAAKAGWIGKNNDPIFITIVLCISILVHECGHMLMFELNGIKTRMFFAVILGGVTPVGQDVKKYIRLPWSQQAAIALAGVIGNCLVIAGSWLFYGVGVLTATEASVITNLNCSLIMFNLIPFSILDGGRFAKILFDSVPEWKDFAVVRLITTVVMITMGITMLVTGKIYSFTALLMFFGLKRQATHDNPLGSHNRRAMTTQQQNLWITIYCVLIMIGILGTALTKDYLK